MCVAAFAAAPSLSVEVLGAGVGVGPEPVAEHERELLSGPPVDAEVDVDRPPGIGAAVDSLAPHRRIGLAALVRGLRVVGGDVLDAGEPGVGECVGQVVGRLEVRDGHLQSMTSLAGSPSTAVDPM